MNVEALLADYWYFSAIEDAVIRAVLDSGQWMPELNRNTKYGTAVYLATNNWYGRRSASTIIRCRVHLSPGDVQCFENEVKAGGSGSNSATRLVNYLVSCGLLAGKTSRRGDDPVNTQIRNHILNVDGKKAVLFEEYTGEPVLAVYDANRIHGMEGVPSKDVEPAPSSASL